MPTCSICVSPKRAEIDAALAGTESLRVLAGRFGTSKSSLARHKTEHLATVVGTPQPADRDSVPAIVPRPMVPGGSLTEEANALRGRAMALLLLAERGCPVMDGEGKPVMVPGADGEKAPLLQVNLKAAAGLIHEARACLELEAKLRGELQTGVTIQVLLANPLVAELFGELAAAYDELQGVLEQGERPNVREFVEARLQAWKAGRAVMTRRG